MRTFVTIALTAGLAAFAGGCQKGGDKSKPAENAAETGDKAGDKAGAAKGKLATGKSAKGKRRIPPPPDVAAPPADAKKTESGIFYKVLTDGTGDERPGRNDTVHVNYTGWKTDGEMFYTSTYRKGPQPMSLAQTAQGWTEALTMMRVGEKRRYWIPSEIAYRRARPGAEGMLVFEVELVKIEPAPPTPPDVAGPPANAKKTKSGLAYVVLENGKGGARPAEWDEVTVHYNGWDAEGRLFESTVQRNRPRVMQLFREMDGWKEAIGLMTKGQKIRAWIPPALVAQRPNLPEGTLCYEFELIDFKKVPPPPPTPKDVAAPPAGAQKTESGVSYKFLKKGKGGDKPTPDKMVKVHYTGWTTDGNMFDSSIIRGQPSQFPLSNVIVGWRDGMQVMSVGDKVRFWIPEELAYKGKPGKPQGMLVFDVELLGIDDAPPPRRPAIAPGNPRPKIPRGLLKNRGKVPHGGK